MTWGVARAMLLAGTPFFSLAGSALALNGDDLLAKINAVRHMQGDRFVADSTAVVGTTVTMKGVRVVWAESGKEPLTLGLVKMVDVQEESDGYRVGKILFSDIHQNQHGERFTARDIVMTDLFVPNVPEPGPLGSMFNFDRLTGGPMTYTMDGKEMFRISGFALNLDITDDRSGLGFDGSVSDIYLDLTGVTDPKPRELINGLGLQQLNGAIAIDGAYMFDTGQIFQRYSINVENAGNLAFDFSVAGLTPEFSEKISKAFEDADTNPDKAAARQALMGYAQQLTYEGATLRFIDDGITARMLDFFGGKHGMDAKETVAKIKSTMPLALAKLRAPDLQKQIEAAVGAYLDDPKSLTVSANPAQPLPAPQIMGAAMSGPANLVKTLNVKVTAND
jgi:hypothetical protein